MNQVKITKRSFRVSRPSNFFNKKVEHISIYDFLLIKSSVVIAEDYVGIIQNPKSPQFLDLKHDFNRDR